MSIVTLTSVIMLLLAAGALLVTLLTLHLALLGSLSHGIQNAEIMFRVLEIRFGQNTVARTGRIASQLKILLEKLLSGPAHPHIGTIAIEHMVAVQRRLPIGVARSTTTAGTMMTASHTFHVHGFA